MLVILIAGITVVGIGSALLVAALRAFRTAKKGDIKPVVLLVIAIGFILFCCVLLLAWSVVRR